MSLNFQDSAFLREQLFGLEQDAHNRRMAPSVLRGVVPFKDGNQWCALLGENIQEGICGFGNSPQEACDQFDAMWNWGFIAKPKAEASDKKAGE